MYHRRPASATDTGLDDGMTTSVFSPPLKKRRASVRTQALAALLIVLVLLILYYPRLVGYLAGQTPGGLRGETAAAPTDRVLVSYSYFEKDPIQRDNFDYFITVGMGLDNRYGGPANADFVVVVNGKVCRPCSRLYPLLQEEAPLLPSLSAVYEGEGVAVLKRTENEGMDFAAHNITLTWLAAQTRLGKYKYYIFLNSSIKGPFVPSYMPVGWQWTQAYTDLLRGDVKAVGSSLVCLPEVDAGGYGPKLESWAFAVDQDGLEALLREGVFQLRTCKLCDEGVVVKGEYGLTNSLMKYGYNVATLMAMYRGVDWRDRRHWRCNNNVHPSRHGTYSGITMHPFETVFLKASWHVGEPFVEKYAAWVLAQAAGRETTGGIFDERMYRYAISPEAQETHHVEECYQVLPPIRSN
ncbi:hypothetical protein C2E20_7243 [Micractinium conductrix]|uniref:Uncharacterized protein n=1 Tax=Micractinium conductrix TaxID=554055 RepID=A0A2P6V5D0_9CHLO|nr:hypothetical protein C2E20_7243 [Micractinium conductrix]|eukprot:PSC69296.1 hypothetical protein C2E20_7243 [Micractinium conductrix]